MTTPTPTPIVVPGPLQRLGLWWDGVVERYNNLPNLTKILLVVLFAAFFYALPLIRPPVLTTTDIDFGGVMFSVAAFALVAVGLNIVIGYAGLLDLGYVGFYAVGAYTPACSRRTTGTGRSSWRSRSRSRSRWSPA
jgi:branched-chain amino acid transport system permease protein